MKLHRLVLRACLSLAVLAPLQGYAVGFGSSTSFTGSNGSQPNSALVPASGGRFWGVSTLGGANDQGAVYLFDPANGSITRQASFDCAITGCQPYASLTPGSGSMFYGTTSSGGASNRGTIYSFNSNDGSLTIQASFDGTSQGGFHTLA